MSASETGEAGRRAEELDSVEAALGVARDVADRASSLSAEDLRGALDGVMGSLWVAFAPHEETERRLALSLGGHVPEVVRLGHRQVHRRLALLATELQADDGPERGRRVARLLDTIDALVEAQIELERWMIGRQPGVAEDSITHCEWCGAEYPVPPG